MCYGYKGFQKTFYWSTSCLCPVSVNKGFISLNGEMIKWPVSSSLASVCSEELTEEYSFVTPRWAAQPWN